MTSIPKCYKNKLAYGLPTGLRVRNVKFVGKKKISIKSQNCVPKHPFRQSSFLNESLRKQHVKTKN